MNEGDANRNRSKTIGIDRRKIRLPKYECAGSNIGDLDVEQYRFIYAASCLRSTRNRQMGRYFFEHVAHVNPSSSPVEFPMPTDRNY